MKRLAGMDAFMLYNEVPPTIPYHTLKITTFGPDRSGTAISAEGLRIALAAVLPNIPPFQWRLHSAADWHHPVWLEHQDVDLDRHVIAHPMPPGAGEHEIFAAIGAITSTPLDRDVPLWEIHVLEDLAGGRAVAVGKIHHALADGSAAAVLLGDALRPGGLQRAAAASQPPDQPPSTRDEIVMAVRDHSSHARGLPALMAQTAKGVVQLRRKSPTPTEPRPFRVPFTSLNGEVSDRRSFAVCDLPMAEVIDVKSALGMTVNDVLFATVTGAVRELLLARGDRADRPLLASVPTKADNDPNRSTGNCVGGMFVELPVDAIDPTEQARRVCVATKIAKEKLRLIGPRLVPDWAEYMPPRLTAAANRRMAERRFMNARPLVNIVVSNVPGPRETLALGEHQLLDLWSAGPVIPGVAVNLTAWSYAGTFAISVHACARMVPDATEVTDALMASFARLREAVSVPV